MMQHTRDRKSFAQRHTWRAHKLRRRGGSSFPFTGISTRPEHALAIGAISVSALIGNGASIATGIALFAAGLPHGFIRDKAPNPRLRHAAYWVLYIAVAGLVFLGFQFFPTAGLISFLALSLIHFALSDALGSRPASVALACLAVGGSALFQPTQTVQMFEFVTGELIPAAIIDALAVSGVAGLGLAVWLFSRSPKAHWSLLVAVGVVAALQPVLAVGSLFYLYHAAPIQRRAAMNRNSALNVAILGGVLVIALSGWIASVDLGQPSSSATTFMVSGAIALTIPHLLEDLLDRCRGV